MPAGMGPGRDCPLLCAFFYSVKPGSTWYQPEPKVRPSRLITQECLYSWLPVAGNVYPKFPLSSWPSHSEWGDADQHMVLVVDKDVPLAVHAFGGVVVGDGVIAGVAAEGLLHQGNGVVGGVRLGRHLVTALVPAEAEIRPSCFLSQVCLTSSHPVEGLRKT